MDLRVVSSKLRRYAPCVLQAGDSLLAVTMQQPAARDIDEARAPTPALSFIARLPFGPGWLATIPGATWCDT
ncbi:MAG: hypothetical protein M3308_00075, partial [Actinomycetota bacterium]|nr:hypothetical protein [Actinomycetota bacterium]